MIMSKEMRQVYCESLIELGEKDSRICVLEADLMAASGTAKFKDRFPDRMVDVGVAESNLIGVAAGMAAMGKIPFANTFSPFATRRCYDQITISVAYSKLNVKICGTDPGLTAELNGGTHMGLEDVALMRALPDMVVFEPVDSTMLKAAMPQIAKYNGALYMRVFRKSTDIVYDELNDFDLFKSIELKQGNDVTIICSGIMVEQSLKAYDMLKAKGISARVINIYTIKPFDEAAVIKAAKETGAIVTAENHSTTGGLGCAVAEVVTNNYPVPVKRIGVKEQFGEVGKLDYLLKRFNMTAEDIVSAAEEAIKLKK